MALPQKLEPMKVLIGALQQKFRVKILIRFIFFFFAFRSFSLKCKKRTVASEQKKISQVAKKRKVGGSENEK